MQAACNNLTVNYYWSCQVWSFLIFKVLKTTETVNDRHCDYYKCKISYVVSYHLWLMDKSITLVYFLLIKSKCKIPSA